jgi:hypothetical protein
LQNHRSASLRRDGKKTCREKRGKAGRSNMATLSRVMPKPNKVMTDT